MSQYAQFDENGRQVQIASNSGWSDFCNWSDTIKSEALKQLVEEGFTENLDRLAQELEFFKGSKRSKDVADIAGGILDAVKSNLGAGCIMVTNGVRA